MASQSTLLGAAGEYFVMSELLRRGYIAALAPIGVPNADIVVTDQEGQRQCAIQVKTRRAIGSDGGWHMKNKHEAIVGETLFYCFVDFGRTTSVPGHAYLVPSATVAEVLRLSHQAWLSQPGKKGQPHKDTVLRRFLPSYEHLLDLKDAYPFGWLHQYDGAWKLLGPPTAAVEDESE